MTNTGAAGITLHLVRTFAQPKSNGQASESWDVTVGSLTEAHQHLDGYRTEQNWITATATGADGAWLGSGRAGFGETRTNWA